MENNNPFQPALSQPVDESVLGDMPSAGDFEDLANNGSAAINNINVPTNDEPAANPLAFDYSAAADLPVEEPKFDAPEPALNQPDDSLSINQLPEIENNTDVDNFGAEPAVDKKAAAEEEKSRKQAEKEAEKLAKKQAKMEKNAHDPNAPKQFTITLPMIIFAILTVVFAALTFVFWNSNNQTNSKLSAANVKVQQLTDEINQVSDSTNSSTGQFSSLQDKIAQMAKQQTEDQKTISDQKNQVNDLNTKLTAANQQASQVKSITDQISALLGNCQLSINGDANPHACSASIQQASADGSTKAGLQIKQSN